MMMRLDNIKDRARLFVHDLDSTQDRTHWRLMKISRRNVCEPKNDMQ